MHEPGAADHDDGETQYPFVIVEGQTTRLTVR
jgi:hypothetical protein